jgi:hypothetical protein
MLPRRQFFKIAAESLPNVFQNEKPRQREEAFNTFLLAGAVLPWYVFSENPLSVISSK